MLPDRERDLGGAMMKAAVNSVAERYGINGDRVILYAGTFEPYQGLDLLVEASRAVIRARKNVRFVCAGGSESQIQRMKSLADQHGVAEYFIFPGTLPPDEVQSLFKISSMVISPRIAGTNTPLKIYSYLRSGVPILATRIRSHTQVLTDDVALLVDPHPESLGGGVLRLLENTELSNRLAQNALQLAETSYSRDSYQRKVAEVLSFLRAKSQRPN